ncbi:YbbR-like domain-containing protein [Capnocytophaga canis]|uniref:YbbR-like protein n=1 Tax=Capnocytophaga canis TaxID=1848903 RepID=A0A3A1YGT4_9FLAO|nr:YbbR-like domain-containing protein [Capnocytophaga canis]RIY36666.1 hypothetical protein CKY20_06990 [Capnocytophaga canis]
MASTKKKIQLILVDRRTVTFVICLLVSIVLWSLIRLSKTLHREFSVDVAITNIPEDMFLNTSQKYKIKIRAEGNGYALLKYYSQGQVLSVDFNDLEYIGNKRYKLSKNISNKLNVISKNNFRIQNTYSDTIYIDLEKKYTKRLPLKVNLNASYHREYQLTDLEIMPDSVEVMGFKTAIDTLQEVVVILDGRKEVKESFEAVHFLKKSDFLQYNTDKITVKAMVDKVSEQIIKLPIQVTNIPEGSQVKTFPSEVDVLCSGDLNLLKNIKQDDIQIIADYLDVQDDSRIPLTIQTTLRRVKITFLGENKVEYLIKKI